VEVRGDVARGFEGVRDVFQNRVGEFGDGGGAFCVYAEGEKVVDLWVGVAKLGVAWTENTLVVLMSATKALAALCAQILYDRGQLDPDARVAEYWPEFAQAGKERVLVRHVLSHTAGVLGFADPGSLLDWEGRGWDDYEGIAARLAAAPPAWEPGTRIGYHAVTVGWVVGELVRRITARTIGRFFREEVAVPLGADVWIGTPLEEQPRVADVFAVSYEREPEDAVALDRSTKERRRDPDTLEGLSAIAMHGSNIGEQLAAFMNEPRVRAAEIPAANGTATAEGLARVYAMLSMKGELDGVRIVSPESIDVFRREAAAGPSALDEEIRSPSGAVMNLEMQYALGYWLNTDAPPPWPRALGPEDEAFGHSGAGGQIGFCDPVNRVAVGFVRNQLTLVPQFSATLVDAVYTSLGR
jgi:CubicO group peptidase (beta-lactamase class C family)